MSIDRAFTIKGTGIVVTGTVAAGSISGGDSLFLQPAGHEIRVRALRVHDEEAGFARAGQRCALNLSGNVSLEDINRGDWLSEFPSSQNSVRIDVAYTPVVDSCFPLKQYAPVKLHLGARRVPGRIVFLGKNPTDNGQEYAHLILEQPVGAWWGQPYILRDHAENVVLGGGRVLDPLADGGNRSKPSRIAWLRAVDCSSPGDCLEQMLKARGVVSIERFGSACNLRADAVGSMVPADAREISCDGKRFVVRPQVWEACKSDLRGYLEKWHQNNPAEPGINAGELARSWRSGLEAPLVKAVMSEALQERVIQLSRGRISLAGHEARLSLEGEATWAKLKQFLQQRAERIPLMSEISAETGLDKALLEKSALSAVKLGELQRVSERRYALPGDLNRLARLLLDMDAAGDEISVISAKKKIGIGRNLTVEVLEYFDQVGFTRRRDQVRIILDASLPERLFAG